MQALKKITIGTINGKRGGFQVKEGDPDRVIGRIFGRADSVVTKATNYGDYLRFTGSIKAINEEREEAFSSTLILPSPADTMLADALLNDTEKMGVTFAFDIVLRAMPKKNETDRGYEFIVKPLMDTKSDDPLAQLQKKLAEQYALPPVAPKQATLPGTTQAEPTGSAEQPAAEAAPEKAAKSKK